MSETNSTKNVDTRRRGSYNIEPVNRRNVYDDEDDSDEEEEVHDDDDDDDDVQAQPLSGGYDPHEYEQLAAPNEIKELFQYITKYSPQIIELQRKLKPFIPEYVPAVGDIDAFIKVQHPKSIDDIDVAAQSSQSTDNTVALGLFVLDEPCINQSDPVVLQLKLRALSKEAYKSTTIIKKVQNIHKQRKTVYQWIKDINSIHKNKYASTFQYSSTMPDTDTLLQEYSSDFEERLNQISFPSFELNVDLPTYVDIICALLDIPRYDDKSSRIEALHSLFSLYLAIKNAE